MTYKVSILQITHGAVEGSKIATERLAAAFAIGPLSYASLPLTAQWTELYTCQAEEDCNNAVAFNVINSSAAKTEYLTDSQYRVKRRSAKTYWRECRCILELYHGKGSRVSSIFHLGISSAFSPKPLPICPFSFVRLFSVNCCANLHTALFGSLLPPIEIFNSSAGFELLSCRPSKFHRPMASLDDIGGEANLCGSSPALRSRPMYPTPCVSGAFSRLVHVANFGR